MSLEGDTMKIKLNFNDPLYVSKGYVIIIPLIILQSKDILKIEILGNDFFREDITGKALSPNKVIQKNIPS